MDAVENKICLKKYFKFHQIRTYSLDLLFLLFITFGCEKKSVETVFPESRQQAVTNSCGATRVPNQYIVQWEDGHFSKVTHQNQQLFIDEFVKPNLKSLRRVEPDQVIHLISPPAQQDGANHLIGSSSFSDSILWHLKTIQASEAWAEGGLGQDITVGVVDTYVDYKNFQLKGQLSVNTNEVPNNGIDDDHNGLIDDYYFGNFVRGELIDPNDDSSHGTHVAGIIAADPSLGEVAGVAPKSRIIAAPFMDHSGSGNLSDAILALNYAVNRGARILNTSWGGTCGDSLRNAFEELAKKDILIISAAGNGNHYTGLGEDIGYHPVFPAAFGLVNQITVAASDSWDFMTSFSNFSWELVHIAAPGEYIKSNALKNTYSVESGTSMASPMVAGAAAVLWSINPQASAFEIREALLKSVDILPNHEMKVLSQGRLNVLKGVQYIKNHRGISSPYAPHNIRNN